MPGEKTNSPVGLRLPDGMTVEDCLLEDRRQQDFIGRHLPFSLADDPTFETVRYDLGDDWLDLLVLYDPSWGWEVQVVASSSEDFDLGDVYLDLRERLRKELAVQARPAADARQDGILGGILERLDKLERRSSKPVEAEPIRSPYLTAEEAAAYLKTTTKQVYHLVARRKLRKLAGSSRLRFTREQLDAYLEGR